MIEEILTPEQIQARYDAALDSVNLLNNGKPDSMDDDEWTDCVARNVGHLEIMVSKDDWNGQDISVLQAAIDANS